MHPKHHIVITAPELNVAAEGQWILDTPFPEQLDAEIETAWNKMVADAGGADTVPLLSTDNVP